MALFHYPNVMLESGSDTNWFVVELLATTLQPALFALGTAYWPVNATWWGNTTLGCYVVHFLFRDRMTELFQGLVGRPVASSFDLAGMRGIHKHDRSGGSLHPHPSPAELGPPEATLHVSEQAGTSHVLNARFGSRTLRGLLRS